MNQRKTLLNVALGCLLLCGGVTNVAAQNWEMKEAPLMTQWSADVKADPTGGYTSYPRPQMVRDNWANLNGVWDLAKNSHKYILPTAQQDANSVWKYVKTATSYNMGTDWNTAGYDDSKWKEGKAGFGSGVGMIRTPWTTERIYLRKKIQIGTLSADEMSKLCLAVFYDEDFEVYINGVLAVSRVGYNHSYVAFRVSDAAKAAIVQGGENLIAVKCTQTEGWQYIDVGLFVNNPINEFGVNENQVYDRKILVPYPVESALSGIMDRDLGDTDKWYSYKRAFTVPAEMKGKQIMLNFGAVDWRCKVFVNNKVVGEHEGGFDPFSFNITSALKSSGEQEVVVQVFDPSSAGGQPRGKQTCSPSVISYTPASGIWQTVWIEGVNETHINDFRMTPDIDNNRVVINVKAANAKAGNKVTIKVMNEGKLVASVDAALNTDVNVAIPNAKLWDTKNPFLYDVTFELKNGNETLDKVTSYFGMRKISVDTVNGHQWIMLNNKPIFQYGTLDQGFWPDGIYTAPTEEALLFDLEKTKEYGFNMIRKHIKVEPAIWYHACDTMGILVWQDMPNGSEGSLGNLQWQKNTYYKELRAMISSLKNHPSIVIWVTFNESWGQFDEWQKDYSHTIEGVRVAREMDSSRLINSVSGWHDCGIGDLYDRHSYPTPDIFYDGKRASVCGETGGVSLINEDHQWSKPEMEYTRVNNPEELKDRFIQYVNMSKGLKSRGMCAAVYTQITDVEMEPNGLIYYDRVMKNTPAQIAKMREAIVSTIEYMNQPVLPTSDVADNKWKYTTNKPSNNWMTESYNDGSWNEGLGGFGLGAPNSTVKTVWNTSDIYLRREVELSLTAEELKRLNAMIFFDEDFEFYINGVLAAKGTGYSTSYVQFEISDAAKAAIRNGKNTLAIHCHQTIGGQFIDLGLSVEVPLGDITSIENPKAAGGGLKVYPNPTEGLLYVSVDDDSAINSISLFDLKGMQVAQYGAGFGGRIDMSNLMSGLYLLKVMTNAGGLVEKVIRM